MKEMGSSDLGFILWEKEQDWKSFHCLFIFSRFQWSTFSDVVNLHKMLWNFWKIGQWMKMGFRWKSWKNQTIYKIHESSKVESKFHLSQLFDFIYCSSSLRQSIVQLSCVHPLSAPPSSSVLSNVSLPWVHPLFHFTKFICSPTSAKLSQVHSLFHFHKSIVCPIILDWSFWISFFQLPSCIHCPTSLDWFIVQLFQLIPFSSIVQIPLSN